jgi:hypothetical protein
VEII